MKNVTNLFNQMESFRTSETRSTSLKQLCDEMAEKAGWHTEYVPNNRSKVKDRVKYSRPFDEVLFCELMCRFKYKLIQSFRAAGCLFSEEASSKMMDAGLRFMFTYKPGECSGDAAIVNRMNMSIRQRAIECNYEFNTKFSQDSTRRPIIGDDGDTVGYKILNVCTGEKYVQALNGHTIEEAEQIALERKIKDPDRGSHIEISLEKQLSFGKNNQETFALADVLEDTDYQKQLEYREDLEELESKYAENDKQKILLGLLIQIGKKTSPKKLLHEYIEETGETLESAKKEVYKFYYSLKTSLQGNK